MGIWGGSPVGLKTKSSAKMESERVLLVDAAKEQLPKGKRIWGN